MKKSIFLMFILILSCTDQPNLKDFRYKLSLPDKKFDLTLFRDRGGVYAPDYSNIYMDFRNGEYKKVFFFNLNDYSFKMVRFDDKYVAFIKTKRGDEITDTTFFDLEKEMIDSLRNKKFDK